MTPLWKWIVFGSDELVLPKAWLANTERMRHYEAYTRRQHQQGKIVAGVEEMRRRAFWEAVEAKRTPVRKDNVVEFERVSER